MLLIRSTVLVMVSMACGYFPTFVVANPPIDVEGHVRFYNVADSDFDVYSSNPSESEAQWVREHYLRMQTYLNYFDSRLSWYPNAWVYKDSYSVY